MDLKCNLAHKRGELMFARKASWQQCALCCFEQVDESSSHSSYLCSTMYSKLVRLSYKLQLFTCNLSNLLRMCAHFVTSYTCAQPCLLRCKIFFILSSWAFTWGQSRLPWAAPAPSLLNKVCGVTVWGWSTGGLPALPHPLLLVCEPFGWWVYGSIMFYPWNSQASWGLMCRMRSWWEAPLRPGALRTSKSESDGFRWRVMWCASCCMEFLLLPAHVMCRPRLSCWATLVLSCPQEDLRCVCIFGSHNETIWSFSFTVYIVPMWVLALYESVQEQSRQVSHSLHSCRLCRLLRQGKSSLALRFCQGRFNPYHEAPDKDRVHKSQLIESKSQGWRSGSRTWSDMTQRMLWAGAIWLGPSVSHHLAGHHWCRLFAADCAIAPLGQIHVHRTGSMSRGFHEEITRLYSFSGV